MAINPATQYPGQITTGTTDYPYGSARDVSSPGAGDGTPVQQAWVNDLWGFMQAMLAGGGLTPSGSPDTATVSQYLTALKNMFLDQSLNLSDLPSVSTARTNLGLGTAALRTVGTSTNNVPDMNSFSFLPSASAGYQYLPSGFILQWGQTNTASAGAFTATLPVAFPNQALRYFASIYDDTNASAATCKVQTPTNPLTTVKFYVLNPQTSTAVNWWVIGR